MRSKQPDDERIGDAAYSIVALDLATEEQAFQLAVKLANRSGRTVTVMDADGEILCKVKGAIRN